MIRLLFDANLSWRLVKKVADIFPDSIHVSRTGLPVPARDEAIWEWAKRQLLNWLKPTSTVFLKFTTDWFSGMAPIFEEGPNQRMQPPFKKKSPDFPLPEKIGRFHFHEKRTGVYLHKSIHLEILGRSSLPSSTNMLGDYQIL